MVSLGGLEPFESKKHIYIYIFLRCRTETPRGEQCHEIQQHCNSGDWILRATSCVQTGPVSWLEGS